MSPAARQLLGVLLLLVPVPAMIAGARKFPKSTDDYALADNTLAALVSGPLSGRHLLMVHDNSSRSQLDMDQIMAVAGASFTPAVFATQHSLLHTSRPAHHTKGPRLAAIFLFQHDPTAFLLLLQENKEWNPSYLVLFCLDPLLNTTAILSRRVVQRPKFLLLLQPQVRAGRKRYVAYTTFPNRTRAPLGVWDIQKFPSRTSLFPHRFRNFGGMVLKLPVSCFDEPFLYKGESGECVGGNLDALRMIGDKHNFTLRLYLLETLSWGVKENGTWNGMLGELIYKDRNIVISSMKVNPDRFEDFDFVYPYWRYSFAILLPVPPPAPRWKNILYPFTAVTWGLVLAATLLVATLLSTLLYYLHGVTDPMDIALKVVSGMLGQAMDDRRVRDFPWARVWLIFWWLSVDILAAAYMSNLMSVLTVPVYPHRIQTLKELAYSRIIPAMTDYGGFVPQALKASTNPVYKRLGDKMYLDPITNLDEPYAYIISLAMNGTHGVIDSIDYVIMLQYKYGLMRSAYIMDEKLYKDHMSWFLKRNTPYTYVVSGDLQRIVETGILGKIYQTHTADQIPDSGHIRGGGVLSLLHLQGAFVALGMGVAAAMLSFLVECVVKHDSLPFLTTTTTTVMTQRA